MQQSVMRTLAIIAGSYNIGFHLYRPDYSLSWGQDGEEGSFDGGIRAWCLDGYDERGYLESLCKRLRAGELMKLNDSFGCRYLLLRVSDEEYPQAAFMTVGPYLERPNSEERTRELADNLGWQSERAHSLYEYRNTVPAVRDEEAFILLFRRLAAPVARCTDKQEYRLLSLVQLSEENLRQQSMPTRDQQYEQSMAASMIRQRYQAENTLLDAILTGDPERVGHVLQQMTRYQLPGRFDSLRGSQNQAIILNTLCRKDLERAGVHPAYIDEISRQFSDGIEACVTMQETALLQRKMVQAYCDLVRTHSVKGYSPLIQQVMNDIFLHMDGEFSLHSLAERAGVSDSYLSARFKEETGDTLSKWIREKRIDRAKGLLLRDSLTIAQVAEQVGILDVSYFIRLFRKEIGMTPGEFRAKAQSGGEYEGKNRKEQKNPEKG